jgi:hypothetical protein
MVHTYLSVGFCEAFARHDELELIRIALQRSDYLMDNGYAVKKKI